MTRSSLRPVTRCACIDVGSNTTRLLVAEDDGPRPRELCSERAFTRLGSACVELGEIGSQKVAEVADVVARQVDLARSLDVHELRIVATSAVREAVDAAALSAAIAAACGETLEILSGEQEALLAFAGAIGMLSTPPSGRLAVVDVGGGSTELVVGTAADGVTWSVSLPLGSSVVTDRELSSDPPTAAELARLRERLAHAFAHIDVPPVSAAYAVGGSASSLQWLLGSELSGEALARGLQTLVGGPAAEVALALNLHAERVRLLPGGLLLLAAAAHAIGRPLQLAGGGLREGVVLQGLARLGRDRSSHEDDRARPPA